MKTVPFLLSLALAPLAQASVIVTLEPADSTVTPGQSFLIDVVVTRDTLAPSAELTGFGFDVDPLGTLSLVDFVGATVNPLFIDVSDPALGAAVAGLADPFGLPVLDDPIVLATLEFEALSLGTETIAVDGVNDGLFLGLYYLDLFTGFIDEDIVASVDVLVVPEPAHIAGLGAAALALLLIARRRRA